MENIPMIVALVVTGFFFAWAGWRLMSGLAIDIKVVSTLLGFIIGASTATLLFYPTVISTDHSGLVLLVSFIFWFVIYIVVKVT